MLQNPLINGELVVCGDGRLDFTALQRRLVNPRAAAEAPASFLVFDVLEAGGTELRAYPYEVRRAVLQRLLDGVAPPLALVPMTTDATAARAWLTGHLDAGIEGVIAKRLDQPYRPRSTWRKVRAYTSTEAIIGGVLGPISAPAALVLGRPDPRGDLRVVGRTTPIPRHLRAGLGTQLRPAHASHPWPAVLPPARYGDSAPVEYARVEPRLVVELLVDTAIDTVRGRPVWRHPAKLERVRPDLRPEDLMPRGRAPIRDLEDRLSELLGQQAFERSGLGAPTGTAALQAELEQHRQANLDLKRVLEERDEELAAARETNRRLMNQLNRPVS